MSGEISSTPPDQTNRLHFHNRAGTSHGEARKLLTGMALAGFGVFYNSLTKPPVAGNKWFLFAAMLAMGLAAFCGTWAWRIDAAWAFDKAEGNCRAAEQHDRKKRFDYSQMIFFSLGLILSLLYTWHFL